MNYYICIINEIFERQQIILDIIRSKNYETDSYREDTEYLNIIRSIREKVKK